MTEAQLLGIKRNVMGTISLDVKVKPMRKAQDFILYPITKDSQSLTIQSDTRIAKINLNGEGQLSKAHQNGAYFLHLNIDKLTPFKFNQNDWRQIVEYIGLTEGTSVGNSIVKTDNSGAKSIFGLE